MTAALSSGAVLGSPPAVALRKRIAWWGITATLWLSAVGFGMARLIDHETGAGTAASAPDRWPGGGPVPLDPRKPTLVMLAHPRCPCTRASIGELAVLMAKLDGDVAAHVLFALPRGVSSAWEQTDQWTSAARIPGVTVHADPLGKLTARFGGKTSGQVLLYSPAGRLLFSGGITPGRAHMGDNAGRDGIVSLVRNKGADQRTSSVFGCSLFDEEP